MMRMALARPIRGRRGQGCEERPEASRRGELVDAARRERCLVPKAVGPDVPVARADGVRDPAHEDAERPRRGHIVELPESPGPGEVFKRVGGRAWRVVRRMHSEDCAKVPVADLGPACRVGKCPLLRAYVYVLSVKAVCRQQPDEATARAAIINDGSGLRRQQQGMDVTSENESRRVCSVVAGMLRGVRLIKTASKVVQSDCRHLRILLEYFLS